MGNPGNPDYLNDLKNTFNDFTPHKLKPAVQQLRSVLTTDLPNIYELFKVESLTVCVVPRAKAESSYGPNQLLFKRTLQDVIRITGGLEDGTDYLCRHTNTRTTHLRKPINNYNNDGPEPFPGITKNTCHISTSVRGRNILLVDDIYTHGVNIDEDAIQVLFDAGASSVIFYAIGKT